MEQRSEGNRIISGAWRLVRSLRRVRVRTVLLGGAVALGGIHLLAWWVPLPHRLAAEPSTVVAFADGSPAHVFLSEDEKFRIAFTPDDLAELDPRYLEALLRFEDKRFYYHPGVDPIAVLRSAGVNLRLGRVASGASTLTMQLVRLLEPRPRHLGSKAVEMVRAMQLELRFSKQEILAAYLSYLPFGRNVEGLAAASWAYFGHGPERLTPEEIAVLLAVPQRPDRRFPESANRDRLRGARNEIAGWLLERGVLVEPGVEPATTLGRITAAAVPPEIRPLPRHAPHAAYWLVDQSRERRIVTTLDRGVQRTAERLLTRSRAELRAQGIYNGSVVVVDHRTGEVKALVGNFDFWDEENGGQIAGFARDRSPGSALKPFIYALGIDGGLVLPAHLVPDIPVEYGDYSPDNYDGSFTGLIALEDALSHSLNIPFVRLLSQVGVDRFLAALTAAGVEGLDERPGFYGLSAAIGALELSPLELAGLYAALARGGRHRPLRWLETEEPTGPRTAPDVEILSRGASFLTRRALARRDRPDFPDRRRLSGMPGRIHWKTGTSYGHRDAWAAGSGTDHTAVVWLGNFDNRSSLDLVGADAAGPILFDLLGALEDRSLPAVTPRPTSDLERLEVCAFSGYLPTDSCQQREWTLALRHRVPTTRCPYHTSLEVDLETGLALNPTCRAGRQRETRTYLTLPASIRRWYARGHRFLPTPPSLAPECEVTGRRRPPVILSPPAGHVLVLVPGMPLDAQEIPLQAESRRAGARISWFVNGELLDTVTADERVWWQPQPGRHEIVAVDDAGLSSRRELEVRARRRVGG